MCYLLYILPYLLFLYAKYRYFSFGQIPINILHKKISINNRIKKILLGFPNGCP